MIGILTIRLLPQAFFLREAPIHSAIVGDFTGFLAWILMAIFAFTFVFFTFFYLRTRKELHAIQKGGLRPPIQVRVPRAPPAPSVVLCPSCKTENRAKARFCRGCGASLQPSTTICPHCGESNSLIARFCRRCGKPLR